MLRDQAAAHYLADRACEVLFRHPGPMRWADLREGVRVLLPVDGATLEAALEADERFVRTAGRWDLAPRGAVGSRPLGGALSGLLECFGRAMPRSLLIAELCLWRPGAPPQMAELLDRLLTSGRDLGVLDDCLYLTSWLPRLTTSDEQGLLFLNELADDATFVSLRRKLLAATLRQRHIMDTAEAVLKAARVPLHNRALGLILHAHHGDRFDAAAVFADLNHDERFVCLGGPLWALSSQERTWHKALAGPGGGDEPERLVDVAPILQSPPPHRLRLAPEALTELQEFAEAVRTPIEAAEAVGAVLGLRPRQRDFAAAVYAVDATLAADPSLRRLQPGRYLRAAAVPPWVMAVPEALAPEHGPLTPQQQVEALVPLAELPPELAALVRSPVYEDVGETEVLAEVEPLQETRLTVAWHHTRCGTMVLRRQDRHLLELPDGISMLTLETPGGERLPVWANTLTGLLYGLLVWYDETLPASGGIIALTRGEAPDTLGLQYTEQMDPAARLSEDRLEQLLHLRDRLRRRPTALSEAAAAVLQGQAKGLAFDALWFQVNLVRRTTRHQLASALVLADQLRADDAGRWHAG